MLEHNDARTQREFWTNCYQSRLDQFKPPSVCSVRWISLNIASLYLLERNLGPRPNETGLNSFRILRCQHFAASATVHRNF
jgi:hypothetical protein